MRFRKKQIRGGLTIVPVVRVCRRLLSEPPDHSELEETGSFEKLVIITGYSGNLCPSQLGASQFT